MRLVRKIECMRDELHFLAVESMGIVVEQRLKLLTNHQVLFRCEFTFLHIKPKYRAKVQKKNELCKKKCKICLYLV